MNFKSKKLTFPKSNINRAAAENAAAECPVHMAAVYRADGSIAWIKLNSVAVTPLLPLLGEDGVSYVDRMTSIVRMR